MGVQDYLLQKDKGRSNKGINVVDLMHKASFEKKKEKRRSVIVTVASLSALAVTSFIIIS